MWSTAVCFPNRFVTWLSSIALVMLWIVSGGGLRSMATSGNEKPTIGYLVAYSSSVELILLQITGCRSRILMLFSTGNRSNSLESDSLITLIQSSSPQNLQQIASSSWFSVRHDGHEIVEMIFRFLTSNTSAETNPVGTIIKL